MYHVSHVIMIILYTIFLQSYGIHNRKNDTVEQVTFVDIVTEGSPAWKSGLRAGDVILSINGRNMELSDHSTLISYITSCGKRMRMTVLFEDWVRKIETCHRLYEKKVSVMSYYNLTHYVTLIYI